MTSGSPTYRAWQETVTANRQGPYAGPIGLPSAGWRKFLAFAARQ